MLAHFLTHYRFIVSWTSTPFSSPIVYIYLVHETDGTAKSCRVQRIFFINFPLAAFRLLARETIPSSKVRFTSLRDGDRFEIIIDTKRRRGTLLNLFLIMPLMSSRLWQKMTRIRRKRSSSLPRASITSYLALFPRGIQRWFAVSWPTEDANWRICQSRDEFDCKLIDRDLPIDPHNY